MSSGFLINMLLQFLAAQIRRDYFATLVIDGSLTPPVVGCLSSLRRLPFDRFAKYCSVYPPKLDNRIADTHILEYETRSVRGFASVSRRLRPRGSRRRDADRLLLRKRKRVCAKNSMIAAILHKHHR